MSISELMEMWDQRAEYDEEPSTDIPVDLEEYDLEEFTITDVLAYRELIFTSPVYQWLVGILRREFYVSPAEQDIMTQIRATVLQNLPPTNRLSRRTSSDTYTVSFHMHWDSLKFFAEQEYGISPENALLRALTFTATSDSHVQCLPCLNYLRQMWPFTGDSFIKFIGSVLRDPSVVNKCQLPDNTLLTSLALEAPNFVVIVNGTADSVGEIAEILGWLVTAFASSPMDRGITYYKPVISQLPKNQPRRELGSPGASVFEFCIRCDIYPSDDNSTQRNGQCWHDLFHNPVVVYGYPILRRPQSQPGLEIPLNVMAALLNEEQINTFQNRLHIKGFNAMLVPTKRFDGLLLWHFLLNEDGSYISYLDSKPVQTEKIIRLVDLGTHRHMVGWCSNATYYAGASDANYKIERSRLPKTQAGCVLDKCSISGGKFVTAGLSFALGIRDKSVQITRKGYIRRLEWISKKFIVFWDEGEKRGWLVNGTSALLHLVRASLEHNSRSKFRSAYVFNLKDLVEAPITHVPGSALDVLLDKKNRKLKIYDDAEEDSDGENGDPKNPPKGKEPLEGEKMYYRFQDRVRELFETLEKIIHYEISAGEESGVEIKFRARKYLEGWDFKDIATDNDPLYPRVATLDAYGKGWVDFTRRIHAITLFGEGFGDVIKPTANSGTCSYWTTLPQGQYYLAATFQDLKEIAELYGDPNSSPMRLSDDIIWHNPGPDRCHCQNLGPKKLQKRHGIGKHSEFAQVLLPRISSEKYRRAGPFKAFVFGHNLNFLWRWGDHGDPAPALPLEPGPDVEVLFDAPSSVGLGSSATASTFSPNVSEITETSQEQLSEELLSGSMQEAPRTPVPDEDEEGSVTEATSAILPQRLHIHDNATFINRHGQPNLRHERRNLARRLSLSRDRDDDKLYGTRPKNLMKSGD